MDFAAVDVETANSARGSICSMGLAVVRNGRVVGSYRWLNRPPRGLEEFDAYNTRIHGIHAGDVATAPPFASALGQLLLLADGLPLVAHNAAFDIGALLEAVRADALALPHLEYACSATLARRSIPLVSYRLPVVARELGVPMGRHHDAEQDALGAAGVVLELARLHRVAGLEQLARAVGLSLRHASMTWTAPLTAGRPPTPSGASRSWAPKAPVPEPNPDADPGHPLHGQVVVITGQLDRCVREAAWHSLAAVGACPAKGVTKKTRFLVIGDGFVGDDPADFRTGKAAKAAQLRQAGQAIEVLTESELWALLTPQDAQG